MSLAIGVDLGGTNLRSAIVSPDTHAIGEHHKERVGEPRDPETIVERVAAHVERLAPGSEPVSVGVGIAAMLEDRRGGIANSPHLRWRNVPFGDLLAKRLGPRFAVGVYNDVNAIVWGEAVAGSARGSRDVLGVYVGTGIGGGLIAGGQLVEGASNCAGEIGHVKVRWDDTAALCACGQRGCVEAYVGGSFVERRIRDELTAGATSTVIALAGGIDKVNPGHVDQAAGAGDDWALRLWSELAPLLAVALGNAVALLNPERLVLGGGMLGRAPTLYNLVVTMLPLVAPVAAMDALAIVPATLEDDAGLVGAASLAASGVSIIR
ncbi:MAG TPA: ROK family protein [Kofleriaceae bacterium]|jgi:glucokinase|nr:ROK family protein [Kofleriaceae bacterium]